MIGSFHPRALPVESVHRPQTGFLAGFYQLFDAIFEVIANFIQFEGYFEDRRPSSNCDPYSGKFALAAALFHLFLLLTLFFSH